MADKTGVARLGLIKKEKANGVDNEPNLKEN